MSNWCFFFCQLSYLNSITSIADILSCSDLPLSWHSSIKPYIILTFSFLSSAPASGLQYLLEPSILAYYKFVLSNHNLDVDTSLATLLFIPHWISGFSGRPRL